MIRLATPRILVVDDEPVMRTITESVLAQCDFEVSSVETAEQAIAQFAQGAVYDLLLLDVLMPGMNGFEACRILRRQYRLEHLPIIMLTALDDQASIDEAYRCGATDFITKPLNLPLLPHRIRYLLRSAQLFQELIDSQLALINTQQIARIGNWTLDAQGDIIGASREYLDLIGASQLPVPERFLVQRIHREDRALLIRQRHEMRAGRPYQIDYRLRSLADSEHWYHVHERGFPRFDERHQFIGADGFSQDITDRVQQEEQIRQLAWHDTVTGLNNRTRLSELLERDLKSAEPERGLAILFIHLANLRDIVTVYGHETGDSAIRALAGRLKDFIESSPDCSCQNIDSAGCLQDAQFGRYDEQSFILSLPRNPARESIRCLADAIENLLEQPMVLQNEEVVFKPFIGIAYYPDDAAEHQELIRRAMLVALHEANHGGSPVTFFDPVHDRDASERMFLERSLRSALEQGGQLEPFFQPKFDAASGRMIGAEVLLRWAHPERGLIPPGRFIPLAEEIGLIHPISEWLIQHVFELIAQWHASGLEPGAISINLSADSFFEPNLIPFIDQQLAKADIASRNIVIELTESVLMRNADTAQHVISALRERGIRISLDDFGTGFSSLGYLNRFTIDEIKIDRSFVIDLERDSKERALVQAIVSLGHALGLDVVAEGIESASQAQLLRHMGCHTFQGFHFAHPMPAGDFERLQRNDREQVKLTVVSSS